MWSNDVEEFVKQISEVKLRDAITLQFNIEGAENVSVSKGILVGWSYIKTMPPTMTIMFEGNTHPFKIDFSKIDKVTLTEVQRTH